MTQATAHPDRRLISSEDVHGTDVYGIGDKAIGQIDHLLIEKISGRVAYAVMSFGGFLGLTHSHYPIPLVGAEIRHCPAGLPNRNHRIPIERRTRL
jgi:hypothetical protein